MSRPIGIAVCPTFPFPVVSGGRKRAVRLLETMERAGVQPLVLTSDATALSHGEEARERGWKVAYQDAGEPPSRLDRLRRLRAPAVPVVRHRLSQLVHSAAFVQYEEYTAFPYLAVEHPGVPTLVSTYNVESTLARQRARMLHWRTPVGLRRRLWAHRIARNEKAAVRRADVVIAVSPQDESHYRKHNPNVVLASNGVDDEMFSIEPVTDDTRDILFFGQIEYEPNREGLLRFLRTSWPGVVERLPGARLRIAGKGVTDELRSAAANAPGVNVLGFVPDIRSELARARAVIAPIWVGGGTRVKVLEALAAARPVVGTTLAVEQIGFESGTHGYVSDDDAGLADDVCRALSNAAEARTLGLGGRDLAQRYRWEAVLEPLAREYQRLGAGNPRHGRHAA